MTSEGGGIQTGDVHDSVVFQGDHNVIRRVATGGINVEHLVVLQALPADLDRLARANIRAEIVEGGPTARPPLSGPSTDDAPPSAGPSAAGLWGGPPTAAAASLPQLLGHGTDPATLARMFLQLDKLAGLGEHSTREIQTGGKRIRLADAFVQFGVAGLWRFRAAASRLAIEQWTTMLRARLAFPLSPIFQAFAAHARQNDDLLRSFQLYLWNRDRPHLAMPAIPQLEQGDWRGVLRDWSERKILEAEVLENTRLQLEAVGQRYDHGEVLAALRDAEGHLSEALKREPDHAAALFNLATLLAEGASIGYVATGHIDRDRLQRAHGLARQARSLLETRTDGASQSALGKCLMYSSTWLPSDASPDSVDGALAKVRVMRACLPREEQARVDWGIVQRRIARSDMRFCNTDRLRRARDVLSAAGEQAHAERCLTWLQQADQERAMAPFVLQRCQAIAPVVGTWACTGQSAQSRAEGTIVLDDDCMVHWMADVRGPGRVHQVVREGGYELRGNVLIVSGTVWRTPVVPGAPVAPPPPSPFTDELMIHRCTEGELVMVRMRDSMQLFCRRI